MGAFKSRLSRNIFSGVNNLVVVPFEDGLTRYFSGSTTDFEKAAKNKVDLILEGFQGAFIVAFKNGKRVPLEKTGQVTFVENSKQIEAEKLINRTTVSQSLVNFSIQLGVFKSDVPSDQLEALMKIDDLNQEKTPEGLTRYYAGRVSSYEEATKLQQELKSKGFGDAQVIGRFKNKTITAQEAIELSK
ncbi:MAG: SPOR domain-containing protein [Flavobacteriales bacterium]|nr:SPOR domain-containing protein [Flavobacteriales bacterium]